MEANCLGYDHAKHSHSCILTAMEDGLYSWANQEKISEARKNIVTARANFSKSSANKTMTNNNIYKKNDFRRAPAGEKTALPCYNHNEGKCRQQGDHVTGNGIHAHDALRMDIHKRIALENSRETN
jgi:hypothetical protein